MKFCGRCEHLKGNSDFSKDIHSKDGLCFYCKKCHKEIYDKNIEKMKLKNREQYIKHKDHHRELNKQWVENNREGRNELNRLSRERHPEYENEPQRKVSRNMRHLIYYSLKRQKNGNHWEDLVGYNLNDLMTHLEKTFSGGMDWNNYGKWHIDHIRPISSFNFNSYEDVEFKECWQLSNLQPLWEHENKVKKNIWKEGG